MDGRRRPRWVELVAEGILVGFLAGALMALVAMIRSAAVGLGFWLPMKLISGLYFGVDTLLGGAPAVVLGIGTHLLVACFWGIVFALVTRGRLLLPFGFAAGLAYGAAVWAIMTYLVLPWADPTMLARANVAMNWFFFYHLVFGITLGLGSSLAGRHSFALRQAPAPA